MPRVPAVAYASNSDPVSFTRTICGGLILPTIATIFGKLLFQRVKSNFQRSIIVRLKIYLRFEDKNTKIKKKDH